jgi:TRAP-type C4-dicarboxylate transport system permease small subunit
VIREWIATMLRKFENFNRGLSDRLEWIGIAGLLAMFSVTCIDVFLTKILTLPIQGAIDIVMFAQLIAIAFALPISIIMGRHIQVEFIVARFPKRTQTVIDGMVSLLLLAFFVIIVWRLYSLGYSFQTAGEKSMSQLRFSLFPFPYAIALASIPTCLVFFQKFLGALTEVLKK